MTRLTAVTALAVIALNLVPAFALERAATQPAPAPAPAPAASKIEAMVPGTTTGAAFLNVRRVFALYGDLIKKAPQYSQIEKAIAAGFPDPAKDIDQVGLVSNIDHFTESALQVVVTGSINMDGLMKFAQTEHVEFAPSMFRGVTLMTSKLDKKGAQLGFYDENTTIISVDDKATDPVHEGTKALVATLKKEQPSFGEKNQLTLPANYLANLSVQIPAELTSSLDSVAGGQFAVAKAIKFVAASVTAEERTKDASLSITLTCDTEEHATGVKTVLEMLAGAAANGGHGADILNQLKLSVAGKNVVVELTIARSDMEHWVANN